MTASGTARRGRGSRRLRCGACRRAAADDRGTVLLLTLVAVAVAIGLVLLCTAITGVHLERTRLYDLADAAALSAAQSFALDLESDESERGGGLARPSSVLVERAVADHLAALPAEQIADVRVVDASVSPDGSVALTLSGLWRASIGSVGIPAEQPIEVSVTARAIVR